MAKRRRKILGLPIGKPQRRSGLERAGTVAAVAVAAGFAGLGVMKVAKRISSVRSPTRAESASAHTRSSRASSRSVSANGIGAIAQSPEARARALKASAKARSERTAMQRKLKSGKIQLSDVFDMSERRDAIAKTRVKILLQNLPGVGPAGALRAMEELGIDPHRRVRGLGDHQRAELMQRFAPMTAGR